MFSECQTSCQWRAVKAVLHLAVCWTVRNNRPFCYHHVACSRQPRKKRHCQFIRREIRCHLVRSLKSICNNSLILFVTFLSFPQHNTQRMWNVTKHFEFHLNTSDGIFVIMVEFYYLFHKSVLTCIVCIVQWVNWWIFGSFLEPGLHQPCYQSQAKADIHTNWMYCVRVHWREEEVEESLQGKCGGISHGGKQVHLYVQFWIL